MSGEYRANVDSGNRLSEQIRSRGWVMTVVLVLFGAVIGSLGYGTWSHHQEQQRFRAAQMKVQLLFHDLTPKAEARLALLHQQLDQLEDGLMDANTATTAEAIPVTHFRTQQRRVQLEAAQVEEVLYQLHRATDDTPQLHRAEKPMALPNRLEESLADMQQQLERIRSALSSMESQLELAKVRRSQLARAESDAARREQAEAEVRRAEAEAATARSAEAEARAQAEAARTAQIQALERAQTEASQWAQKEALQRTWVEALFAAQALTAARQPVCVQPTVRYVQPPLVIGSWYPDRPFGSRQFCNWGSYPFRSYGYRGWCW